MTEELLAQRVERLVQERNLPALLAEAQQLLAIYLGGEDRLDLEPVLSAQAILQRVAPLQPPPGMTGLGDRGGFGADYDRANRTVRLAWSGGQVLLAPDEALDLFEYLSDLRQELQVPGTAAHDRLKRELE